MRIRLDALRIVDETGEDHDAQDEEEHQQGQLLGRGPERLDEDLQTGRMARQLKESHYPDNGEELEDVSVLQMRCESLKH